MDASLVATVLGALGAEFAHYAIYAPSDYDLLIMAADAPIPYPPQAAIFEQPGVAKELWTVHVLSAGDLDARYLGSRATLEPLFASYGMPANSDYAPVLDRNAARHRFTEKSAAELVDLLNAEIPLLELLEPERSKRAINPLFQGAYAFERVENTRLAWYARDFLLRPRAPVPEAVPRDLQKDLELVKLRLLECREPRELDVWLHSAIRVAQALNPYLAPDDVGAVWGRIVGSACYPYLQDYQRRWLALFQAIGARNAARMAELAVPLLAEQQALPAGGREYLLLAALTGYVASGAKPKALELWDSYSPSVRVTRPAYRLLRCHADLAGCGSAFRAYAER
jgi:spermidine synthase